MNYPLKSTRTTPLLWEFLLSLLQDNECQDIIRWIDEPGMKFKIVNSHQVATLWGDIKGRPNMNENKLRRAIRQYYKLGVMKKVIGQKGGYKFGELPYNPFSRVEKDVKAESVHKESSNLTDVEAEYDLKMLFDDLITDEANDSGISQPVDNNLSSLIISNIHQDDVIQSWMKEQQRIQPFLPNTIENDDMQTLVDDISVENLLETNTYYI